MGISFEVSNKLGNKYQEKHYQKAIEIKLKGLGIPYEREKFIKVNFGGAELGKFFVDFVIDNKLILEIKKIDRITQDDIKQVIRYLEATGLKLAIIINFRRAKLEYRRVVH